MSETVSDRVMCFYFAVYLAIQFIDTLDLSFDEIHPVSCDRRLSLHMHCA
jgi:hypothetical protein